MSEWIISIVGVIMLGVLLEIVLPEGNTAKYVRGAFSLLVVFAIAAPLPALFGKDFTFSLDAAAVNVDGAYADETYDAYAKRMETAIEEYLRGENFVAEASVRIEDGRICGVQLKVTSGDASEAADAVAKRLNLDRSLIEAS